MRTALLAGLAAASLILSGCSIGETSRRPPIELWPDMDRQEKFKAQSAVGDDLKSYLKDGRSNRRPPEGVVARGRLMLEDAAHTGLSNLTTFTGKNPVPLTMAVLLRGQERFNVYCTPCHDKTGSGHGIVNIRDPLFKPATLTDDRIVAYPDGQIFYTITNGKSNMKSYRNQLSVEDRWAVVYYVRALQRSHAGTLNDVPEDKKGSIN